MTPLKTAEANLKFGFTVGLALIALAAIRAILYNKYGWIMPGIGIALCLVAYLNPQWLNPFRQIWTKFGYALGAINTYVLLTLFYYLILTPLSLISRLCSNDFLKLKRNKNPSYWEDVPPGSESNMKNQF